MSDKNVSLKSSAYHYLEANSVDPDQTAPTGLIYLSKRLLLISADNKIRRLLLWLNPRKL